MAQQKIRIKLPKWVEDPEAVGLDIIQAIVDRARNEKKGYDKGTKREYTFHPYKRKYADKKGVPASSVDLTLSSEMLDAIQVLTSGKGFVTIGFDANDTTNNGKAEGNAKGTYGQRRPVTEGRPFLGLSQKRLKEILDSYKEDQEEELEDGESED